MKINQDGIASRVIDGQVYLVTVKNRFLHMFNGTGTRIWQLIKEGKDIPELITQLITEYEVDKDTATQDVHEFIAQLKEKGILK